MDLSRRSVLHLASVGVGMSVAGCSAITPTNTESSKPPSTESPTPSQINTESPNPSSTESPTASPTQSVPVTFSAEVLRQATKEHPPQLRARLENQSSENVRVSFGPALLFTDNAASDEREWDEKLVIDPETYVGPWGEPTHSEGCWRFPEDGSRSVQSSLNGRDLSPSDSLTETYEVYTHGTSGPCLPEGTYQFQDKGFLEKEGNALILTLSLEIDKDQQLTVNTEETGASND